MLQEKLPFEVLFGPLSSVVHLDGEGVFAVVFMLWLWLCCFSQVFLRGRMAQSASGEPLVGGGAF